MRWVGVGWGGVGGGGVGACVQRCVLGEVRWGGEYLGVKCAGRVFLTRSYNERNPRRAKLRCLQPHARVQRVCHLPIITAI